MLFATASVGFAQEKPTVPLSGKLQITGSSTMAPLVAELATRFQTRYPGVIISVEAGGSGRGVSDAMGGISDIGMASRDLAQNERSLFAVSIARDGVAIIVHKDNPLAGITKAQMLGIYTGKVASWRSLGGPDIPIETATRTPGHSSLEIMASYLGITPGALNSPRAIDSNADVLSFVSGNRNAIAFVSTGAVENSVKRSQPVKPLALDGKEPGVGSIRDGTWVLARPLNLLTRRVPAGLAKAFIEFSLSPQMREVILARDFVPYLN